MKNSPWVWIVVLLLVSVTGTAAGQREKRHGESMPPAWAFGGPVTLHPPAAPDSTLPQHVPGSRLSFTFAQAKYPFGPADWHPAQHPPMPEIVAHGRRPNVIACTVCHMANGKGRSPNAPVAGLPVEYFVWQIMDFRNGLRLSADPTKVNVPAMIKEARGMTMDDIRAAAKYYHSIPYSMPPTPWIKVVESTSAPKTWTMGDGGLLKLPGNRTAPLGDRIIEVPDSSLQNWYLRDDHAPYTAYVPVGSIQKGEALVTTGGGGKTIACEICHGPDLEGIGPVPPLAGRSPSYLGRQLYNFQHGFRKGPWSALMQRVVKKLTSQDMVDICAYISSRPVHPAPQEQEK